MRGIERHSRDSRKTQTTRTSVIFFFFQAEDGIRDYKVTGVQTCALPISAADPGVAAAELRRPRSGVLPSHDARLGADRRPRGALLRDGRQPRRILRQPLLGLPAAQPHRGTAAVHLHEHRPRPAAYPLESTVATAVV